MFDVSISIEDKKITTEFLVDSYFFEKDKYVYAFYLIKEGEKGKLQSRWYRSSMKAVFEATDISGIFYTRCFVRDKEDKSTRTFDSEKISINV